MASWADQVIHHILIETSFALKALWRWTGPGLKALNHFQVLFQTHSSVKLALSRVTWPREWNFYPTIDDTLRFVIKEEIWFISACLFEHSVWKRHYRSVFWNPTSRLEHLHHSVASQAANIKVASRQQHYFALQNSIFFYQKQAGCQFEGWILWRKGLRCRGMQILKYTKIEPKQNHVNMG